MPLTCPFNNQNNNNNNIPNNRHIEIKLDDKSPTKGIATHIHGYIYIGDEIEVNEIIAKVEISILLK